MIIECSFCEIGAGRWNHKPGEKRMLIKNMGEHPLEVTHRLAGKFGVAESGYVFKLTRIR
jgi:hypothetical protein